MYVFSKYILMYVRDFFVIVRDGGDDARYMSS